jgi:hypothetical protein
VSSSPSSCARFHSEHAVGSHNPGPGAVHPPRLRPALLDLQTLQAAQLNPMLHNASGGVPRGSCCRLSSSMHWPWRFVCESLARIDEISSILESMICRCNLVRSPPQNALLFSTIKGRVDSEIEWNKTSSCTNIPPDSTNFEVYTSLFG